MAQATFSIRMDEKLKREFDILCSDFGMNATWFVRRGSNTTPRFSFAA